MESDERLQRMEAEGILTSNQASLLRASLGPGNARSGGPARSQNRRAITTWLLASIAVALVAALFFLAIGAGTDPQTPQNVAATLNQPGGIGEMNKGFSGLIAIAVLLIIPLLLWTVLHNSIVSKEESVFEAWAQTESNLERRADLIPAVVETVSRFLRHESETLVAVTAQRGNEQLQESLEALIAAQQATADLVAQGEASIVESEADLAALYAAQQSVAGSMRSFLAVAENYPELRSSDQFLELQAQLEGTENRINVARMRFNEAVAAYNAAIRKLPGNLIAGIGGFQRKAYFQADQDAQERPELAFD